MEKLSKRTELWFALPGLGIFLILILIFLSNTTFLDDYISLTANVSSVLEQQKLNSGLRISIPKINVDAIVEYSGLTVQGTMDVPKGPSNAGWFYLGTRPGEKGTSVIDGHSGWKNGIPAVFDNLYRLHRGDKIYIEDDKGVVSTFVVRENRMFDPKADSSEVFNSRDDKSHLNLITCDGSWNIFSRHYSNRLVVFADKEV